MFETILTVVIIGCGAAYGTGKIEALTAAVIVLVVLILGLALTAPAHAHADRYDHVDAASGSV